MYYSIEIKCATIHLCYKDHLYFKETERNGDKQIVFDGGSGRWEFGWEECCGQLLGADSDGRWDF